MRIVALEEHFIVPDLAARIDPALVQRRGFPPPGVAWSGVTRRDELADLGPARIADLDAAGITVQVLSVSGPGADLVAGADGIRLARDYNDALARGVAAHPGRLAGFAHLPMLAPEAAADELERAVRELGFHGALINGLTDGRCLDHPAFDPILGRAAALDVPIYIHPGVAAEPVRHAYYDGLPGQMSYVMATAAWGWHIETAVQVLRLVLSGAMDRHPGLKIIVGHMGEALPFMLARCEQTLAAEAAKVLRRTVTQTILDQVWITTSGFFTVPPFLAALQTFGADRIMFSVDYPFAANPAARRFLDMLPVSPADREKIAHATADTLLKLPAAG
ncbi:MAG: amidohydrolase [Rhodospirillales bacterium]|nr:amidohydrolase [Rhodospirillales bacterium]